ncbi:phasin family protein [Halomonas sp. TRM85114]|uniref:phasin family protein n=1 Tax=Halomonas jincaotanensis TaxID=2810616 RepID=UPI001BD527CB|nr:phasin family protein [Halomonas jincaotanensis]MBS9405264.1 phasin family protein [Halomonas jincaotanensis]
MSAERSKTDVNQATEQATEQFDKSVAEPARAYGALTTDYFEQLFSAQFDAVRAFADTSLAQSRSWLEVKDADSLRQVIEEQQKAVQEMSERLKEDADKIRSLSQDYLKETQQLTMESMQTGRKQLEENMQKGQKQFQDNLQKGQDQVEDSLQKGKEDTDNTQQKSQQQTDKSKKSTSS